MSDLRGALADLRDEARRAPGAWAKRQLGGGLELHWRFGASSDPAATDELVLRRADVLPSDQEVTTCLAHLPAGRALRARLDYVERRTIKLLLGPRRCACGTVLEESELANEILYGEGPPRCSQCQLAEKTGRERRMAACVDCGKPIPFDPVYEGNDRCNACALFFGRRYADEIRARRAAASRG